MHFSEKEVNLSILHHKEEKEMKKLFRQYVGQEDRGIFSI
jgi:hypothetical protein